MRSLRVAILLILLALAGCGTTQTGPTAVPSQPAGDTPTATREEVSCTIKQQSPAANPLTPLVVASELTVGPNRFTLGLLRENTPVENARVHLCFFKLEGEQATLTETAVAPYFGYGLGGKGVYVAHPNFNSAGDWGLVVFATPEGEPEQELRAQFKVLEQGTVPQVGDLAISVATPLASSVADIKQITSDPHPDPRLYQVSLDQALKQGRPTVLIFATPGFCQTAVCGPDVEVVKQLFDTYGQEAAFIHVEVYQEPSTRTLAAAMVAWRLQTEPWLFLIDGAGLIQARYEGGITRQEVEPDLKRLLGKS
jgi:hypothetical protein